MTARLTRSESGFTYIAALVLVVIMGIMLGAAGQSMKTIMKREKEKELIFRGLQYRDAIERWTKRFPGQPLNDIKKLIDPGGLKKDSLIRQLYKDPVTGDDFKLLTDQNTKEIQGVASSSDDIPFKQGNFPEVIKDFEGKKKYSDWQFVYKRLPTTPTPAAPTPAAPGGTPLPGQQQQLSLPLSTPESP